MPADAKESLMIANDVPASRETCSRDVFWPLRPPARRLGRLLALARGAHAAGSDVIKVGLIGCGGRGSGAAANAMNAGDDVRLVAMADIFEDKVQGSRERPQEGQARAGGRRRRSLLRRLRRLQEGDRQRRRRGADRLRLALPPAYLKAAVDAGKHVFWKSPTRSTRPGIRVVEAGLRGGQEEGPGRRLRALLAIRPGVRETIKRVLDGAIGDDRRHPGDLHAVALPAHRAPAGLERDGVAVPQLVPLQLAFRRRHRRSR